jgi:flagellar export protein FliJ
MPPKFSLQNVLDVRHSRVEGLEIEMGKLLALKLKTENLLHAIQQSRQEMMEKLSRAQTGELDLFEISMLHANIQSIEERIKAVEKQIKEIENSIQQKQQELLAAKQDEEVLQILRRKRNELFEMEQNMKDARVLDDIYIAQAFRQRQQEI